jgi:Circularly permutated YpsA SLOG family
VRRLVLGMSLKKIVSGGQTGVDRAALDAALAAQFPCGGWAPWDRMAEDGVIPDRYRLVVLPKGGYRQRTRMNVVDSSGTAILFNLKGGTRLTRNLSALEKKPYILVKAWETPDVAEAAQMILKFIEANNIEVLNVAGPRLSGWKEGYRFAFDVISGVIRTGQLRRLDRRSLRRECGSGRVTGA